MSELDRYQKGLSILHQLEDYLKKEKIDYEKHPSTMALRFSLPKHDLIQVALFPSGHLFVAYNSTHKDITAFEDIEKILSAFR